MSCTVSGNVKNLFGINASGGQVTFKLLAGPFPQISGTNIIAPQDVSCAIASNGSFGITLYGNDQITPSNSVYAVSFNILAPDVNGNITPNNYSSLKFSITGSTFNMNSATPVGSINQLVWVNQPVLLNPTATQTITQPSSTSFNIMGGDVGIGTTSPAHALDVNGDAGISGTAFISGDASISGNIDLSGNASISGNIDLSGQFNTQRLAGDVFFAGAASVGQKALHIQNNGANFFVGIDGNTGQGFGFPYQAIWYSTAQDSTFDTPLANFTGGITVGSPTGGNKGNGTINVASGIYLNNTAYTNPDYVFEKAYTGEIKKFANNPGAADYKPLTLEQTEQFTRDNLQLPGIGNKTELFSRADALLEKLEEAYLYIFELNRAVKALQLRVEVLEQKS